MEFDGFCRQEEENGEAGKAAKEGKAKKEKKSQKDPSLGMRSYERWGRGKTTTARRRKDSGFIHLFHENAFRRGREFSRMAIVVSLVT